MDDEKEVFSKDLREI